MTSLPIAAAAGSMTGSGWTGSLRRYQCRKADSGFLTYPVADPAAKERTLLSECKEIDNLK
jgi:hypothetical protein